MSQAEIDILAERQRQIHAEGWDEAHDEKWSHEELACAAACYAAPEGQREYEDAEHETLIDFLWPFDRSWWKPTTRRRDLVKAGALIIAEIDRMDRAAV